MKRVRHPPPVFGAHVKL